MSQRAPGLGGEFTYCTLGQALDAGRILSGETLPDCASPRAWLFHVASGATLDRKAARERELYLGDAGDRSPWMIYRADLNLLKSADAAPPETPLVRDALIKRFELTFEMAWKCMYRWLRVQQVDVPQEAFRVIPCAFSAGLIDDDAAWTAIRQARNRTSHTYAEKIAIAVAAVARERAGPCFRALHERLRTELDASWTRRRGSGSLRGMRGS